MNSLITSGLMYGALLHVDQPNLVERYRKAMACMGLKPTALEDFYIDAVGFSEEVADEISDRNYLDPNGIGRRLIVLTPEQRKLPVLNAAFSADVDIIRRFYVENDRAIRTLTLKDAVYGDIENLLFDVNAVSDVLGLREVNFELHTPSGILEDAVSVQKLARKFSGDAGAWKSDDLQQAIVAGAKRCGDVRTNGIIPTSLRFAWPDVFRTSHFGGIYVLRGRKRTIVMGPTKTKADVEAAGALFVDIADVAVVFNILRDDGYMEPLNVDWLRDSGVLDQRLELLVAEIVSEKEPGFDLTQMLSDPYASKWMSSRIETLRADPRFAAVARMRQIVANNGDAAKFEQALPFDLRMLFRRAIPDHPGAWDVNRIILRWNRYDTLSLHALDKPGFYEFYETLGDRLKDYTVKVILRDYHVAGADIWRKKAEFRERLFGIHQII